MRWRNYSHREPTEEEVYRSNGMLIVCSDSSYVCVMPVQLEPVRLEDGTLKLLTTFSVPYGSRWSGAVTHWMPMPQLPGAWKKWLNWQYWWHRIGGGK